MEQKPKKQMEVKTIHKDVRKADEFDHELNAALAEGWYLRKRVAVSVGNGYAVLIAEMQRFV